MPVSGRDYSGSKLFSNLLTFWTGIQRDSVEVLAEQDANNQKNTKVLCAMREQAFEMLNLVNSGSLDDATLGQMLDAGWQMKCSLAPKISNSFISSAYDLALSSGAFGGKISGAGGGGFLNLIVPEKKKQSVILGLEGMGLTLFPISPETQGTTLLLIG